MKHMRVPKIIDIFKQKEYTLSFEFFPPKKESQLNSFFNVVGELVKLGADFISVTYGAGGGTREKTMEITTELQTRFNIPTIHHITCVGHSKQDLIDILDTMKANRIVNILALRGDPPKGIKMWKPTPDGLEYAYQLCDLVSRSYGDYFSCGVAGFPEGHPEAPNKEIDIKHLKNKIEHGGEFIITQLFYENKDYFDFVTRLRDISVNERVIPGILPVFNFKNLKNFCAFCGATIPPRFYDVFGPIEDDLQATERQGIEIAIKQCTELLEGGAPGLHFYTLNKLDPIKEIVVNLRKYL
ncbi:MAG: methylenetetrahydrofolate reductase [NAD(P)H] [Candidatus Heimdallarchaeota archaeon]|nr:MAG: methylenetetrahydrofolate reductase [NAD(P)H] [Candidatus Heimdallarchaeota archaeon]